MRARARATVLCLSLCAGVCAAVGACNLVNGVDEFSLTGGAAGSTGGAGGGAGGTGGAAGSEPGRTLWSRAYGSPGADTVSAVVPSGAEGAVITGFTSGVADFQGAKSVQTPGLFVAHIDASGAATDLRTFATGPLNNDASPSVVLRADGTPVLAGVYQGDVDFGGGAVLSSPTSQLFVASLGTKAPGLWALGAGSGVTFNGPHLAIDANDNTFVFVDGRAGTLVLGADMYTGTMKNTAYLAKISKAGSPLWSRSFSSTEFVYAQNVAADVSDGASVYIAGKADVGPVDCGCPDGPLAVQPYGMFVAKYDGAGACVRQMSYGFNTAPHGLVVAANGDLVVAGAHSGGFEVEGTALAHAGGAFNFDAYILRFTKGGKLVWARSFGAPGHDDDVDEVVIGDGGDVFAVGHISGSVDVGNGVVLEAATTSDLYVIRFSGVDGKALWGRRFANKTIFPVLFAHIASDGAKNLRVGGLFSGDIDFGDVDSPHSATGGMDGYLVKLAPN